MKSLGVAFLSAAWLLASCAAPPSRPRGSAPPATAGFSLLSLAHESFRLPNGLSVYFIHYPSPDVVAYQLPVHVGSRNEVEAGKTGFAHFFEHLMFRGTKHLSGKEFGDLYARLGAENNAWTGDDETVFHGMVTKPYLAQILQAEADRFENLSFDEKALRDEAGAVLGEYNKDVADPDFQLEETLDATAFTAHPYRHTTMGYKADILNFGNRYQDVWPFFHRYYRPGNVSLILVGDFDFQKAQALIEQDFGAWKNPRLPPVSIPKEPEQTAPRAATVTLAKPLLTRIAIAYKIPAFTTKDENFAALEAIAEMSFSTTSPFQKTYRFEKRWLDSIDASASPSVDPGLWVVTLRLSELGRPHVSDLIHAVEAEIQKIQTAPMDLGRLAATKQRLRNEALTDWFDSPDDLASQIAFYTNLEPDLGVFDRLLQSVDGLEQESIRRFAASYLTKAHQTIVTLVGAKP